MFNGFHFKWCKFVLHDPKEHTVCVFNYLRNNKL